MSFGVATKVTNKGVAMLADRLRTTPATYTSPPKFIALGVGATGAARTAAVTDTALSSELTEGRATGTESIQTTTVTGDTMRVVGTVTATGSRSVDEFMTNDASSTGNMNVSGTMNVVSLTTGDSLQLTVNEQITTS